MIITTPEGIASLLEFIHSNDILAYDIETDGLNARKNIIIGFGISNAVSGFYVPVQQYNSKLKTLVPYGVSKELVLMVLTALTAKKLLMFNASFDTRFTKNYYGIDLLGALHTDVMLLKHTCDEDFPMDLKGIATKLWGTDVKKEKEEMLSSIKANKGTATEFYKADTGILGHYCIQDCLLTFRLFSHYSKELKKQGLVDFYYTEEVLPLYKEVTIPMEECGIHVNVPYLTQLSIELGQELTRLEGDIKHQISPMLGDFNAWFLNKEYPLKSSGRIAKLMKTGISLEAAQSLACVQDYPGGALNLLSKHHLKKLFFDELGETPLSRTPTGLPQVDEEFLESIKNKHLWVQDLITFNKLTKLKGTYIDRFLEEQEDGIFYPSYQQHRTVSGRYSGDFQQLPRMVKGSNIVSRYTSAIRKCIIPSPGRILISADYQQLEPTIFAHASGDTALQNIFLEGRDFYSEIAIRTERISGASSLKSDSRYLGLIDPVKRQAAKVYALGIPYGLTGYKLAFELPGLSQASADTLVRSYWEAFPELSRWAEQCRDAARHSGRVSSQCGRVRHLTKAKELFAQYGAIINDDLALWKIYHTEEAVYAQAKLDRKIYKNQINNAVNFCIQSLAASVVNRAAIALARQGILPCGQVHDELIFDVWEPSKLDIIATIKEVMENVMKLDVPLKTDPIWGANYAECK